MSPVVQELTDAMQQLSPDRTRFLEDLVRDAMTRAKTADLPGTGKGWPPGFFERTAGMFADEPFERPDQGEFPVREEW